MKPKQHRRPVHGVLLVNKPAGLSSNRVLQIARHALAAEKAGHTGTLDPFADGLLPLCFGEASKFAAWQLDADKRYRARLRLGITTTTGDPDGEVLTNVEPHVQKDQLLTVLRGFLGEMMQTPPMYSALKFNGKPLYAYARAGIEIPRNARQVFIRDIQVLAFALPYVEIEVLVSAGTYVRTLAEDIGQQLGCGAHLVGLTRLASGGFSLAQAVEMTALEVSDLAQREAMLLPADALIAHLPRFDVDRPNARRLLLGQRVRLPEEPNLAEGMYRVYGADRFLGLVDLVDTSLLAPMRMMQTEFKQVAGDVDEILQ